MLALLLTSVNPNRGLGWRNRFLWLLVVLVFTQGACGDTESGSHSTVTTPPPVSGAVLWPQETEGGACGLPAGQVVSKYAVGRIAFTRYDGGGQDVVGDADRSNVGPQTPVGTAVWSPDGERFAMSYQAQILVMDVKRDGRMVLTDGNSKAGWPVWSPDGTQMAFLARSGEGGADVFVADVETGDRRQLTDDDNVYTNPVWSPDGTRIAFEGVDVPDDVPDDADIYVLEIYVDDREIFVINTDGTEFLQLTDNEVTDRWPVWAPDGSSLAYFSYAASQQDSAAPRHIVLVDADGGNRRQVTDSDDSPVGLTWSSDSTRIAFRTYGERKVFIATADGSSVTEVAYSDSQGKGPVWSPDGSRLVFEGYPQGPAWGHRELEIFVVDAEGQNLQQLTDGDFPSGNPVWSPDGTRIAFASMRAVFVMEADGSNQRQLTDNKYAGRHLVWSPDGSSIAFDGVVGDNYQEVWVIDVEDGSLQRLTFKSDHDKQPVWGPEGLWFLLFTRYFTPKIFVMEADGGNQRQLTTSNSGSYNPVWSPDGTHIAFSSGQGIHVMDADGQGGRVLAEVNSEHFEVRWSPDGRQIAYTDYDHLS